MYCQVTTNTIKQNTIKLPVLEVEVSKSGHIDGGVGDGVVDGDDDELEVEEAVQTQDKDEDGNDHYRHGAGTEKPFGVKRG